MSKALALVSFRDSKSLARGLGVQGVIASGSCPSTRSAKAVARMRGLGWNLDAPVSELGHPISKTTITDERNAP